MIGRVFDDRSGDGRFNGSGADEGERDLPGVRLADPSGVAVTTDPEGRYSLPRDALPVWVGKNLQTRLDARTLPPGATLATQDPGVARVTPGLVAHMDLGAAIAGPVRNHLDLWGFSGAGSNEALQAGLATPAAKVARPPAAPQLGPRAAARRAAGTARRRPRPDSCRERPTPGAIATTDSSNG